MARLARILLLAVPFACNEALGLDAGTPITSDDTGGMSQSGADTEGGSSGTLSGGAGGETGGTGVTGGRSGSNLSGEGGESATGGKGGGSGRGGSAGKSGTGGSAGEGGVGGTGGANGGKGGANGGKGGANGGTGGRSAGAGGRSAGTGGESAGAGGRTVLGCSDAGAAGAGGATGVAENGTTVVGIPCDQYFDSGGALSEVETAINSAAGGTVICVWDRYGWTWEGSITVNNTAPTATNRVVVCASADGITCGDYSYDSVHIVSPGNGITFDSESDGFVFANITVDCTGSTGIGYDLDGASHIRLEGGGATGCFYGIQSGSATAPSDDIEIGLPGALTLLESNFVGLHGWLTNSTLRLHASDNAWPETGGYHVYLTSGVQGAGSENVVIEHSRISGVTLPAVSGTETDRTCIRLGGQNRNIAFRYNTVDGTCRGEVLDCSANGGDLDECCDGVELYGNEIYGLSYTDTIVNLNSSRRVRVYNNLIEVTNRGIAFYGRYVFAMNDGGSMAEDGWFFNNNFNCSAPPCRTPFHLDGTGHRIFNNLFNYPGGSGGLSLISDGDAACNRLGANGEHFSNNFLYSTDNSPVLPACGTGNSTTFNTKPGFLSDYLHIAAVSPVAGFGRDEDAPDVDYDGVTRPSPPSAGALDVH